MFFCRQPCLNTARNQSKDESCSWLRRRHASVKAKKTPFDKGIVRGSPKSCWYLECPGTMATKDLDPTKSYSCIRRYVGCILSDRSSPWNPDMQPLPETCTFAALNHKPRILGI